MAEEKKDPKILIIVAVIGLVGTLGTALLANWIDLFPPSDRTDNLDQLVKSLRAAPLHPRAENAKRGTLP